MMRWISLFLLACTPSDPADLQAPPPGSPMFLQLDRLTIGERMFIEVSGAIPGSDVTLYRTDGGVGAGSCPSYLQGECFGITDGSSGPRETLTATADIFGTVRWAPIVPNLPVGTTLALQAVSTRGSRVRMSQPEERVFDQCPTDSWDLPNSPTISTSTSIQSHACDGDIDGFEVEIPVGYGLQASLDSDPDLGSVEFRSLSAIPDAQDPELLEYANRSTTPDSVRLEVRYLGEGTPALDPFEGVPYTLHVDLVELDAITCTDAYEPNDSIATMVAEGEVVATMCHGDMDRYVLPITPGSTVRIELDEPDLFARQMPDGRDFDEYAWSTDEVEFFIRHVSALPNDRSVALPQDYTFTLEVDPPSPCPPDALEPNDDEASATILAAGGISAGACASDPDWYQFDAAPGDLLTLGVSDSVQATLYAPDGTLIASGRDLEDGLANLPMATGTHHLVVVPDLTFDPEIPSTPYTVDFTINSLADCPSDAFEPNDAQADAVPITGTITATGCVQEDDWYTFEVTQETALDVRMQYNWSMGQQQATVRLLRPDGTEAPRQVVARQLGTWTIHADTYVDANGGGVPYTLVLDQTPIDPCPDDAFEPNESQAEATQIAANSHDAVACMSNEDWFRIPSWNSILQVRVDYDTEGGDQALRVEMRRSNGLVVDSDQGSESLEVSNVGYALFWVRVLPVDDVGLDGIPYTVTIERF